MRPYAVRFGSSVLIQQVDHYIDYRSYRTAIRELPLVTPYSK